MILFLISLLAGLLTVLAPCVLPLLPVIIGGSLSGDGKGVDIQKVLTIVLSLGASVIVFTLLLKVSTLFITIPSSVWTWISGGIIIILGFITLFPGLWQGGLLARLNIASNRAMGQGAQKNNFWGNVTIGAALGPVFSTCSPAYFVVLATVLPSQPLLGMVYLLTYTFGLCVSLFLIAFVGQKVLTRLGSLSNPRSPLKRILGVLFILVGISVIAGWDKKLQIAVINSGLFDITQIEQKLLMLNSSTNTNAVTVDTTGAPLSLIMKQKSLILAPEISTPDGFINTDGKPVTLESLKGKVVLLDIWTYSCINCQRTVPYLNDWYAKYHDQGLEIIGLHTPEFAFEKVQSNVEKAVADFGINYPVVLDNDFSTWNAYGNQYWPRKYLIDMDGYITYDHAGEGDYMGTEAAIVRALTERAKRLGMEDIIDTSSKGKVVAIKRGKTGSPEVYFGYHRNELLGNGTPGQSGARNYTAPAQLKRNELYFDGMWNIEAEYADSLGVGKILFNYEAQNVYMVAGADKPTDIEVYQDGKLINTVTVTTEALYQLVGNSDSGVHLLELRIIGAGLRAFTFTFE